MSNRANLFVRTNMDMLSSSPPRGSEFHHGPASPSTGHAFSPLLAETISLATDGLFSPLFLSQTLEVRLLAL